MRRLVPPAAIALAFATGFMAVVRPDPDALGRALPGNAGDPALIVWILLWGAHSLTGSPGGYFDAPIFWPHDGALTYSDPLTPLVPVYGALFGITGSWALALNLLVFALVGLNLVATYLLTTWLTANRVAGVTAAFAFAFGGYVLAHWGHVQLQTLGFLPLAFWLLFKVLEGGSLRLGATLGVVNACVVLSALYYGAAYAIAVVVVLVGWLGVTRLRPGLRPVLAVLTAGAVTAGLVGPFALRYLDAQDEGQLRRPLVPQYGLDLEDLVRPAPRHLLYDGVLPDLRTPDNAEHRFFPGFVAYALAAVGLASLVRHGRHGPRPPVVEGRRRYLALLAVAGVVLAVFAAGPDVMGAHWPYRLLYWHVPGFDAIRVTSRLAVVTLLAVAVLAGAGFAAVTRHRSRAVRVALAAVVPALLLLEAQADLDWARFTRSYRQLAVYEELASRPPGVVVELPIVHPRRGADWAYVEAPRMVYASTDWNPRVNGYSGFIPADYFVNVDSFGAFPDERSLARARELGVRYVILHGGDRTTAAAFSPVRIRRILAALPGGATAERHGADYLVDLGRP